VKNARAVKILIAANVAMFLLQLSSEGGALIYLELWPRMPVDGQVYFRVWQIVTYAFLHSTDKNLWGSHLIFNMLGLWMFGAEIERYVGPWRLASCYFASVITAALAQLIIPPLLNAPPVPTIGASGGVFGLLLAYAMMFPQRRVIPLIPPIPMPACRALRASGRHDRQLLGGHAVALGEYAHPRGNGIMCLPKN
jgi:membrane associated rhomboid family serine protease